jgi:hypothetical protein
MRRILLSCAILAVLTLPVGASARASGQGKPGYLVVRKAVSDGGVNGKPVVTVVVHGFVLGRVSQEAVVEIYHLGSAAEQGVKGQDISTTSVRWHGLPGKRYRGSNFRFHAIGGSYRVVVRGSGLYLFAGGVGKVWLRGSSLYRADDGWYSLDGSRFRSLPETLLERKLGRG